MDGSFLKNAKKKLGWFVIHTLKLSEKLAIECPELKRKRKKPAKFLDSSDEDEERFPNSPKEHFQNIFFEIFGLSIGCLKDRFEQEDLEHYTNLQDLLTLISMGFLVNL